MITVADLRSQTVKDLSAMARKMGLTGVHTMRKDQLVRALVKAAKAKSNGSSRRGATAKSSKATARKSTSANASQTSAAARGRSAVVAGTSLRGEKSKSASKSASSTNQRVSASSTNQRVSASSTNQRVSTSSTNQRVSTSSTNQRVSTSSTNQRVVRKIQKLHAQRETRRDLSHATVLASKNGRHKKAARPKPAPVPGKDRIVLLVRDPYWLQACWDVTRQSVARAKAALAEHWHTCEPTLRLMQVESGATTATSERVVRDMRVHGGVKNWYIDIQDSPNSYRVELGYLAENGRFFALSRSNVVTTPRPGSKDAIDENWADIAENYEKIYALSGGYEQTSAGSDLQDIFEEQLRRPMGTPIGPHSNSDAPEPLRRDKDFDFQVDAEMIIYGSTKPEAHVTLSGDPVRLRPDGTFTVRMAMPDRRQLLPVVASSRDGAEQRTIVLAVERNTKVMEPMSRESQA